MKRKLFELFQDGDDVVRGSRPCYDVDGRDLNHLEFMLGFL